MEPPNPELVNLTALRAERDRLAVEFRTLQERAAEADSAKRQCNDRLSSLDELIRTASLYLASGVPEELPF